MSQCCPYTRARSEYPVVVIPLSVQHYPMLQRNLIYTGVTHDKRLVVLVGQRKAWAIAVKGDRKRRRWSKLREWLALDEDAKPVPGEPPKRSVVAAEVRGRLSCHARPRGVHDDRRYRAWHRCYLGLGISWIIPPSPRGVGRGRDPRIALRLRGVAYAPEAPIQPFGGERVKPILARHRLG
jgi:hypothetical protein